MKIIKTSQIKKFFKALQSIYNLFYIYYTCVYTINQREINLLVIPLILFNKLQKLYAYQFF